MDEKPELDEFETEDGLNQKRMKFINHYVEHGNATKAAQAAGYSEESAHVQGCRLLKNDKIQREIRRINADLTEEMKYRKQSLMAELWRVAKVNAQDAFNENGTLKNMVDMPENVARAVKSVEVEESFDGYGENKIWTGYTKKIHFYDKLKAIETYGRAEGIFVEKTEITINDSLAEKMRRARERARKVQEDESNRERPTD